MLYHWEVQLIITLITPFSLGLQCPAKLNNQGGYTDPNSPNNPDNPPDSLITLLIAPI